MPVHFFIEPTGITLERARTLDPDAEWQDMRCGKERWIVQTYARLRRAGHDVSLGNQVPDSGIVVYHKQEERLLLRRMRRTARILLVAVRADFRSADAADYEVLQNGHYADDRSRFFIPFWPQPGLIPREPSRGDRLERVVFKGNLDNLDPALQGDAFRQRLEREGISYELDAANRFDGGRPMQQRWHDYADVDAVLALRPLGSREHTHKPATKLYNAWLAGVPAVLTSDYAFRELRRSPLDYIEAATAEDAFRGLMRLRDEPGLYRNMVANGLSRSRDFTVSALTRRWEQLLFEVVPGQAARRPAWASSPFARNARRLGRKVATLLRGGSRK
jgi:hypothetical protein